MKEPIIADKGQALRFLGMLIAFAIVFVTKPYLRDYFTNYPFVAHAFVFAFSAVAIGLLLWMMGKKSAGRKAP